MEKFVGKVNNMKKEWYKSRTLWIAVAQSIVGIITVFIAENPELKVVGGMATVKSVIDTWLRFNTVRGLK